MVRHDDLSEVYCSVARTWAVVGERWTMMILRECYRGETRYEQFRSKLGVSRNVLTDRLGCLTAEGVLERVLYQDRPPRFEYVLTERGEDLYPVLLALVQWGDVYKNERPPVRFVHKVCGHDPLPIGNCNHCGESFGRRDLSAVLEPDAW